MPEPTDDMTPFENRLAARLQADAAWGARLVPSRDIADAVFESAAGRRASVPWWGWAFPSRRWIVALVTVLLIAVALAAATFVATRPPRIFPTDLLAYTSDASRSLWVVPRDGGTPKAILRPVGGVGPLAWSSDGRWLATTTIDDQRILLVRPDGTDERVIGRGHDARWSRDGRRIAFVAPTPDGGQVTVRDIASGVDDTVPVPEGFDSVQLIGWLGDDAHVLVRACSGCGYNQDPRYGWFTLPDGRPVELPAAAQPGTLSPDGWLLAWSPCAAGGHVWPCPGLYVSDLRSGETRQVGDPDAIAYDPMAWGPDGTWIAYPTGDPSTFAAADAMVKARLDGSAPIELGSVPADIAVSPDGTDVAIVPIEADANRDVLLVSSDGSRSTNLVKGSSIGWIAWQPPRSGILSPDDPAAAMGIPTCTSAPGDDGRMPPFEGEGCIVVRTTSLDAAIVPLDLDPAVAPINVLDVNWDRRSGPGPGTITGIHDTTVVPLTSDRTCTAGMVADGLPAASDGPAISPARGSNRWCIRTKAGTLVELTLVGYDLTNGTVFAYRRAP